MGVIWRIWTEGLYAGGLISPRTVCGSSMNIMAVLVNMLLGNRQTNECLQLEYGLSRKLDIFITWGMFCSLGILIVFTSSPPVTNKENDISCTANTINDTGIYI